MACKKKKLLDNEQVVVSFNSFSFECYFCKSLHSPVRNCLKVEVQVHSGFPSFRENRHSRCRIEPGNTARSPDGSTEAEPDGILMSTVGGESSEIRHTLPQTVTTSFNNRYSTAAAL